MTMLFARTPAPSELVPPTEAPEKYVAENATVQSALSLLPDRHRELIELTLHHAYAAGFMDGAERTSSIFAR